MNLGMKLRNEDFHRLNLQNYLSHDQGLKLRCRILFQLAREHKQLTKVLRHIRELSNEFGNVSNCRRRIFPIGVKTSQCLGMCPRVQCVSLSCGSKHWKSDSDSTNVSLQFHRNVSAVLMETKKKIVQNKTKVNIFWHFNNESNSKLIAHISQCLIGYFSSFQLVFWTDANKLLEQNVKSSHVVILYVFWCIK